MVQCPDCGHECIENEVAVICPNCDYLTMKTVEWKGDFTRCPKCRGKAKVYKHSHPGKSFICSSCNTIGRFFDENKFQNKIVRKDSELGKKLTWLFEVPCSDWKKREEVLNRKCKDCDLKEVCDAHLKEIENFCAKKDVEIYVHKDFIEVMHS